MDWKKENIRTRYIDSITDEEARAISFLGEGEPSEFSIVKIERDCNGNNIPHVKIHYTFFDTVIFQTITGYMGIFSTLDIYRDGFRYCHCQKEIFDLFKKFGFE